MQQRRCGTAGNFVADKRERVDQDRQAEDDAKCSGSMGITVSAMFVILSVRGHTVPQTRSRVSRVRAGCGLCDCLS